MDDKNLDEEQKQQEAGEKTAHVAGKAAANIASNAMGLGNAGGALYNAASNSEIGKRLEQTTGSAIQQNPYFNKASQALNDSGALDTADKAMDMASGLDNGVSGGLEDNSSSLPDNSPLDGGQTNTETDNENDFGLFDSSFGEGLFGSSSGEGLFSFSKKKKRKMIIISSIVSFFLVVMILVIGVASKFAPIMAAIDFVSGAWNGLVDFITKDQQEYEEEFYQELKDAQDDIHQEYGVCIDINLITSTLTVNVDYDDFLNNSQGEAESEVDDDGEVTDYTKMKKQVRLLANMQMMTKIYSLDKSLKDSTGYYCSTSISEEVVTADNMNSFKKDFFSWISDGSVLDSSTPEKIANNDKKGLQAFFTKKVNEETNYAYYIYHPASKDGSSTITNDNCSEDYAKNQLPSETKEVSIGDYKTRKDSVYYWNLVNSFIPEYYNEFLPKEEPARQERILKIADDIYLLYEQIGPSKTCTSIYTGPSALCPNGVTIQDVGTFELEEYIAGVVTNEAYTSEGMEALKAQAVAARTYVLYYTDYCSKSIPNSTNAQTFNRNINDRARQAAISTAGEILTYNGSIFSSQYDSFCYDDKDCPDSKKNSDSSYTVTYTKVPNGEKHTVTLSDSSQFGRITHGQGHAHGMSQLVSYQLAKEGKNYREILTYFYSDGVAIDIVLSANSTDGGIIINKPIQQYLEASGSTISSMNEYIYSNVRKAGLGTRNGVVAAATSLVSGFYNQTGHLLPYELYPSGKYKGYGIDPNWGTNTGRSDYPVNGLDCSGFISWAIHNGGYAYDVRSASTWGSAGTKREWFKGKTDSSAQPGDLIFNKPASANGTTGHIRMIIGVNDSGYIVAEASSRKNGVRITEVPFTSKGSYYLVDMSNYYSTATKVTDYPG